MIPKKLVLIRLIFIVDGYSLSTQNFSTRLFEFIFFEISKLSKKKNIFFFIICNYFVQI
jgi:hypothetical protein